MLLHRPASPQSTALRPPRPMAARDEIAACSYCVLSGGLARPLSRHYWGLSSAWPRRTPDDGGGRVSLRARGTGDERTYVGHTTTMARPPRCMRACKQTNRCIVHGRRVAPRPPCAARPRHTHVGLPPSVHGRRRAVRHTVVEARQRWTCRPS